VQFHGCGGGLKSEAFMHLSHICPCSGLIALPSDERSSTIRVPAKFPTGFIWIYDRILTLRSTYVICKSNFSK
jgi:hypothetical protein